MSQLWRFGAVLSAAVGIVVAGSLVSPSAQAAEKDKAAERPHTSWAVSKRATVTLSGHGYGHGHGMSQYGAEGAAQSGLTASEIIDFYYPGTTWGTTKSKVSVLISADTSDDVEVLAKRGLAVRDLSAGETVRLPSRPSRFRLLAAGQGTTVQALSGRGKWRSIRQLSRAGEFRARGPISLVTPGGVTRYRGRLQSGIPSPTSTARDTVNILSLEKYLRGVVPSEIPSSWDPQAVQAQAIAARTYAAYERSHPRARHYQICDTTSCQVYGGVAVEHPAATAALKATKHQIVTDEGAPAFSQFSSSSGGWTAAGEMSYLSARQDPYDGWSGNPNHDWTATIERSTLERAWSSIGELQRISIDQRDGNGEWGGRVVAATLVGSQGQVKVSGDTLRSVLGLRSTWFTMAVSARR